MSSIRRVVGAGVLCSLFALQLAGCTTNPYTGESEASNKAKGAAIGAAAGAVIGVLTGDDADERRKRALIGAGVGALSGPAVGAYMDAQEDKLRAQLQGTGVSVTRIGDDIILNMPGNVTFDVDRADVNAGFYEVLKSVALVVEEFDRTLIDVAGHTDSTGDEAANLALSRMRAEAVAAYMAGAGVAGSRITAIGVGSAEPLVDETGARARRINRRIDVELSFP